MTFDLAHGFAHAILAWLAPYCQRMEIAGSIRRRRPVCGDVDLVVIPKVEQRPLDLLHVEQFYPLREFLISHVNAGKGASAALAPSWRGLDGQPGPEPRPDGRNYLLQLRRCKLDIWLATPETWATVLMCRTGSVAHNVWLAARASRLGCHWNPYRGVLRGSPAQSSEFLEAASEKDIYRHLKLPLIPPEHREAAFLPKYENPARNGWDASPPVPVKSDA